MLLTVVSVELADEAVGDIVGYLRAVEVAEETDGGIVRRTWLHFGRNFGGTWLPLSRFGVKDCRGDFKEDCRGTFKEDYRGDFKEEIDNSSVQESSQRDRMWISFAFPLWYSKFL